MNAIFVRGNKLRLGNNFVSNEYFFRTPDGDFAGDETRVRTAISRRSPPAWGVQPELLRKAAHRFTVERDAGGYTIEMSSLFCHVGRATYRLRCGFVAVWHYNQTAGECDGRFGQSLTHTGGYAGRSRPRTLGRRGRRTRSRL